MEQPVIMLPDLRYYSVLTVFPISTKQFGTIIMVIHKLKVCSIHLLVLGSLMITPIVYPCSIINADAKAIMFVHILTALTGKAHCVERNQALSQHKWTPQN